MAAIEKAFVKTFACETTGTGTHVLVCAKTRECAVIDSVLDYDPVTGKVSHCAEKVVQYIRQEGLRCRWVLETHAHADHLTDSVYLKRRLSELNNTTQQTPKEADPAGAAGEAGAAGAAVGQQTQTVEIAIGEHIRDVQAVFGEMFNIPAAELDAEHTAFDRLFAADEEFQVGELRLRVLHTPGHTPACVSYHCLEPSIVFCGDTIFMPDQGSARCDFPGGSSRQLFASIQRLLSLPDDTRMFVGHDYCPGGRERCFETTVALQKSQSIHVKEGTTEEEFCSFRSARDATLSAPRLLLPSIQINIRGGLFPPAEHTGTSYIKIPIQEDAVVV
eukprot:CAMPEP_0177648190 /NCGR_PEP_ID=MMETSP0447-20121125/10699_1 /TAXON_ID=0 /ORGANISM="Stygamoeba regulata, Strain BSH-02190019" /LENGTH=331 /DNA_ID=CAMNT_0019150821 /DNA_START=80 /DNA_END=1075 /DNA_ORIENTATION=+